MQIPRLVISALRGGSGKTLLSLGLVRALTRMGHPVKPYKKGPDYIDAAWLQRAAGCSCTNLDPYFLEAGDLRALMAHTWPPMPFAARPMSPTSNSVALIEGNRGLYDGRDVLGSCSTAELARVLDAPVIITLDVTKMTRTAAAVITGLINFEDDVHIAGVVLNQVGSSRHQTILRNCIEHYTDVPILGALPRLKVNPLPERHMGLMDVEGEREAGIILDHLAQLVEEHVDVERIVNIAASTTPLPPTRSFWPEKAPIEGPRPRIGYVHDAALWFYYKENLEALERAGAELVRLSVLDKSPWPEDLQGLYLGGGFPEEFAEELSHSPHLAHIRALSEAHMPIYAECGGFMLLCASILRDGVHWPMSNIFPVHAQFLPKPQGLGYVMTAVTRENPFHPVGSILRGHEFHYSRCVADSPIDNLLTLRMQKGVGMGGRRDGLLRHNTYATYTHIYAHACPWWGKKFVNEARKFTK